MFKFHCLATCSRVPDEPLTPAVARRNWVCASRVEAPQGLVLRPAGGAR